MKTHPDWSYAPYRPPFIDCGEPYISRVVPSSDSIHLEWLPLSEQASIYTICCRERGTENFTAFGSTENTEFTIRGLVDGHEYEFFVQTDERRSRIRLARCGEAFGTVVNYLHPDDDAYAFSGRYLCSPSLLRHPDGYLLASMDLFAADYPQNLTLIYRSDDDGATWHYVSELFPCFWGKLFAVGRDVYMLACSTEYGDLLIGKSTNGGKNFCEPTVLLRGGNGKNGESGVHKNPQPVITHAGRLWATLEWGSWGRGYHAPMVMSAPCDADLLRADSWVFSEPVRYDPTWPGVPAGPSTGNIEGSLVVMNGTLYNVMRYDMGRLARRYGLVIAYRVDTERPERPLQYDHCIEFPANYSKFEIRYDPVSRLYYSVATRICDEQHAFDRTLLSLMSSPDGEHWRVVRDLMDRRNDDPKLVGFQYADFFIENRRLYYLCRTAMNGAHTFHDANYSVFDRIDLDPCEP